MHPFGHMKPDAFGEMSNEMSVCGFVPISGTAQKYTFLFFKTQKFYTIRFLNIECRFWNNREMKALKKLYFYL